MTTYLIPANQRAAAQALIPAAALCPIWSDTGQIDRYIADAGTTTAPTDTAVAALGATVHASPIAALATIAGTNGIAAQATRLLIRERAKAALAGNATYLAGVQARRTAITNGIASAGTLSNITVTTVAQVQAQLRIIGGLMVQIGNALGALNDQSESNTKQNDATIRDLLGQFDSSTDT